MTALIFRLWGGKGLPCPHTGSWPARGLIIISGDLLAGLLWSSLLPLRIEEEAESSEARRGQSFGNDGHIPRRNSPQIE